MNLVNHLLRKNLSVPQLIGFVLSNFLGLAIVIAGIQMYADIRSIWEDEDSFVKKDFLIINKQVKTSDTFRPEAAQFTPEQIQEVESQPWVRSVGRFSAADYRVYARVSQGGRSMSTMMFFEALPDEYIDVKGSNWHFSPQDSVVPIILSKDYLSLYNFGFASGAGMPRMSEGTISAVPMQIDITGDKGRKGFTGRIVGFSNRLNTILVPQSFMDWSNKAVGDHGMAPPASRLIIDVNSPGDVRINEFLEEHEYEVAGEKGASSAAYMLNVLTGVVVGIGLLITVMSLFILLMSVSLLMYKNREKIHTLIMLGYDLDKVSAPYRRLVLRVNLVAFVLAVGTMLLVRMAYLSALEGMGASTAPVWVSILAGLVLLTPLVLFNIVSIRRKIRDAFYA